MINRETRQGYAMHSGKGVNEQGHGPNGPSLKVSSTHDEMLDSTLRLYNRFPPSEALAQQPDHGIEHHSTRPSLLHVLQKGTGAWYCSSLSTTCDLHTMVIDRHCLAGHSSQSIQIRKLIVQVFKHVS